MRIGTTPGAREAMAASVFTLANPLVDGWRRAARRSSRQIVRTNALTLPAHRLSVRADRTGALMCVPIKVESRLLGTLHIFRERGYHFNEERYASP